MDCPHQLNLSSTSKLPQSEGLTLRRIILGLIRQGYKVTVSALVRMPHRNFHAVLQMNCANQGP